MSGSNTKVRELTPGQKDFVVRCYEFMTISKEGGLFRGQRTRDLVAACLKIAHGTVTTVMDEYRADNTTKFEPKPSDRGKKRDYDPKVLEPIIHNYIDTQNKLGKPVTAQKIISEITEKASTTLELRTMQRLLNELDFHYVVGKKRHILADTAGIASFRTTYIEKKLFNRCRTRKGELNPRKTEVFLDESFCNVNHVAGKTWLLDDRIRYNKSGKGPRACIIGAGFISCSGGRIEAGFVEGSIKCWNATLKRKTCEEDDYHGNFNTAKFERWFKILCSTLQTQHGACVIHMDSASYHKNQTNRSPTMQWKRDEMRAWLTSKGVNFSLSEPKAKLMERVTPLKERPVYQAQLTATQYGHYLLYTPPYHPELQPIELIWATVKGRIAHDPPKNANDAVDKVLAGLHAIKPKEWVNVYRHTQGFENMYKERASQTTENKLMAAEDKLPL